MIDVIIAFPGMGKTTYAKYATFSKVYDFELKDFKDFRAFALHVRKIVKELVQIDEDAILCFGMQPQIRKWLLTLAKQYYEDICLHLMVPNVPISQWVKTRLSNRSEDFQLEILSKGESYIRTAVEWADKNGVWTSYTSATLMEFWSYNIGVRDAY